MALANEIQVGRFNKILTKLFNMKEGAPSPVIAPEYGAGITVESDRPEWAALGGDVLFVAVATGVTAATAFVRTQLRNPTGSGVLAIVDRIIVNTGAAAWTPQLRFAGNLTEPVMANVGYCVPRDLRQATDLTLAPIPLIAAWDNTNGDPAGSVRVQWPRLAAGSLPHDFLYGEPIILKPGSQIFTEAQDAPLATTLIVTYWGRVRAVEPSELTGVSP